MAFGIRKAPPPYPKLSGPLRFSHCGWLVFDKHKSVIEAGNELDFRLPTPNGGGLLAEMTLWLSDLRNDSVVEFQKQNYAPLSLLLCFGWSV